jgi:hypothetical protein
VNLLQDFNDLEITFIVLVIIYFAEGYLWLTKKTVCILGSGKILREIPIFRYEKGGWVPAAIFPWSTFFICESWPLDISPEGVAFRDDNRPEADLYCLQNSFSKTIDHAESGVGKDRVFQLDKKIAHRFASEYHAEYFQQVLERISTCNENDRGSLIEDELANFTDFKRVEAEIQQFKRLSGSLKYKSTLFFGFVFIVAPVLYLNSVWSTSFNLLPILIAFFGFWWLTLGEWFLAHRKIHPMRIRERWSQLTSMALVPTASMHGAAVLSKNLFADSHPLTVVAALSPKKEIEEMIRPILLRLEFAIIGDEESICSSEISRWYSLRLRQRINLMLQNVGIDPNFLIAPPEPLHDAKAFCPRCHGQFVFSRGTCHACCGVKLVKFADCQEETCQ